MAVELRRTARELRKIAAHLEQQANRLAPGPVPSAELGPKLLTEELAAKVNGLGGSVMPDDTKLSDLLWTGRADKPRTVVVEKTIPTWQSIYSGLGSIEKGVLRRAIRVVPPSLPTVGDLRKASTEEILQKTPAIYGPWPEGITENQARFLQESFKKRQHRKK